VTAAGAREMAVRGALVFTAAVFTDSRGTFTSPLQEADLVAASGRPLFPVRQVSFSRSRRDVVRGVHFTAGETGTEKYVYCPAGRVLDVVVDLRVGSPTFGRHDTVLLDGAGGRAVYLPAGVGHAFVALEDDSVMAYLLSAPYRADAELAVSALDPALQLPVPRGPGVVMSDRDRAAPTLAEAAAAGLLPHDTEVLR
jgi:5-epimerase